MAFNGSGVFSLVAGNPVVTGTTISSTWANNTLSDIATGLSTTLTKDGQSTPTANIPMGGFKITGLGAATLAGDALRFENIALIGSSIQAQTYTAFTTGGTTTAYTLTPTPALTSLVAGQRFSVVFNAANTSTTPTLAISGLTAKNLKVYNTSGAKANPAVGALALNMISDVEYDGTDYVVLDAPLPDAGVTTAKIADANVTAAKLNGAQSGSAPIFGVRAWVQFNGTGTVAINGSGNVSSITDNGTGDYTVNFTTAMSDANYAINVSASSAAAATFAPIGANFRTGAGTLSPPAAGSSRFTLCAGGTAYDCDYVFVQVIR